MELLNGEVPSHLVMVSSQQNWYFVLPIDVSIFKCHSVILIGYQIVMMVVQLSNRHQLSYSRHLRSV